MEQKLLGPLYFLVALIIALVFGLLYSSGAFASPGDDGCVGNCSDRNAVARANARAYAAALTRVEQNVTVTPTAAPLTINNALPAATPQSAPLTINNNLPAQPEQRETINVRTVPTVITGNVYPTAPCMGSSTVGAAALGWGASVGTSWSDHECGKRETARSFQNLGMTADAVAVLCSSEYAAVAPVCMKK